MHLVQIKNIKPSFRNVLLPSGRRYRYRNQHFSSSKPEYPNTFSLKYTLLFKNKKDNIKSKFASSDPDSPTHKGWDIRSSCKSMRNFLKPGQGKIRSSEAESEETQLSQSVKLINIEKESENMDNFTDTIKETKSKKFDLNLVFKEDWRNGPFSNIIFDKKAVTKERFHHHLIRTYEGLNHVNSMKLYITTEMIRGKSVELKRTGKKFSINVKKKLIKLIVGKKALFFELENTLIRRCLAAKADFKIVCANSNKKFFVVIFKESFVFCFFLLKKKNLNVLF